MVMSPHVFADPAYLTSPVIAFAAAALWFAMTAAALKVLIQPARAAAKILPIRSPRALRRSPFRDAQQVRSETW
jgi:hypothetical protein